MSKNLKLIIIIALILILVTGGYFIVRANKEKEIIPVKNEHLSIQTERKSETAKNEHGRQTTQVTSDPNQNLKSAEIKKKSTDLNDINLSPSQQVIGNVAVDTVKTKVLIKEIFTVGKISYDETKFFHISSWMAGRIDKIYTNFTGMKINKGDKMLEIYSPDLVSAQQEHILAYESYKRLKNNSFKEVAESSASLLDASRQRLLLLGIKDWQINELEKNRKARTVVPIFATATGIIVSKNVQEGHYVETGASLFDIADLSTVWMEASVYEYGLMPESPPKITTFCPKFLFINI